MSSLLPVAAGSFNPIAFDPAAFVLTLITVLVLLFLLRKFAWGPILLAIETRESRIEEAISQAEKDREQAQKVLAEYQETVKNVESEVAALREQGRTEADAIRKEILSKAEEEANARADRAVKDIELARRQALEDIRKEAVGLGMAIATKVVGRSMEGDDQRRLASDVVDGLSGVATNGSGS